MVLAALLLSASSVFASPHWHANLAEALSESESSGKPVLLDFQAPWCYSCYYMEKHVLDGAAFAKAAERFVLLKLDVDQAEGHALKEKYRVNFLPSYLLIAGKDKALGRIIGEQTEADFLKQLDSLLVDSAADARDRAVLALRKSLAAGDYDQAAADISILGAEKLKTLQTRLDWRLLAARLELMRAVRAKRPGGVEALKTTLALDDSCAVAYDADYAAELVDAQKPEARKAILEMERAALEKLAEGRLFSVAEKRCADFRTGIEVLADVYEKLGLKDKREELLKRTVSFLDAQGLKPGEDRNFDDNKRFFLELQGDEGRLHEFYAALVAAYPADYVYAYRWAKHLQEQGQSQEALPLIEKADRLTYGANRLTVSKIRAKILASLGRRQEAIDILRRDAKAGRAVFPKEAQSLEEQISRLTK